MTRPTAERAKEAMFSMIQFEIEGRRVLDLFAGSGQLGLEALSRGAEKAHLVDRSADATAIIKQNAQKTRLWERCRVVTMDFADYIRGTKGEKFDFIFLDPPYGSGMLKSALEKLAESELLADGAWIFANCSCVQLLSVRSFLIFCPKVIIIPPIIFRCFPVVILYHTY